MKVTKEFHIESAGIPHNSVGGEKIKTDGLKRHTGSDDITH